MQFTLPAYIGNSALGTWRLSPGLPDLRLAAHGQKPFLGYIFC